MWVLYLIFFSFKKPQNINNKKAKNKEKEKVKFFSAQSTIYLSLL